MSGNKYGHVGSAWMNDSGMISIELNPFTLLPCDEQVKLYLYPKDYKPKAEQ